MKITYLGQNTFIFGLKGHTLISDPALSVNPLAKDIDTNDIHADYILLTHAHGDHVADVLTIPGIQDATIIANYEIATYYGQKGRNCHPMNHGGRWAFDFGELAVVNAIHSSVFPDGTNGGNPNGFVIQADDKTIYMAGDTALTMDMQLIPRQFPSLDVAILPIGDNFTMGIDDAIIAAEFVQCKKVVACHFDSFPYIEIDHDIARKKFGDAGIELILLNIGESTTI